MRQVFADSSFWIALINPRDNLHALALQEAKKRNFSQIVTSEMVLVEVLNFFAQGEAAARRGASNFVHRLTTDHVCEIVAQTQTQFERGFELYLDRPDQGWSMTDCTSMLIMETKRIHEVLTEDKHFRQAGYITLLKPESR